MFLRDNTKRLKVALSVMIIMVAVDFIGLLVPLFGVKFIHDIEEGNFTDEYIEQFALLEQAYGIAYLVLLVVTMVVFIMWFRRAYYNVHEFALSPPRFSEGWAAGAWFVPILSLFRPVQIMRELWLETTAYLRTRSPIITKRDIQTIITLWWVPWIVANILSNISFRMSNSESLGMLRTCYYIDIATSLLFTISGVFLIIIMKNYGELEEELQQVQNMQDETSDSIFY